jgi:hypothetical protein
VNSTSALTNKSYSNPEATLTSPNVALNAVRQENHSGTKAMAAAMVIADTAQVPLARCSLQHVPIVARKLKYRLSHAKTDLYIAVIATAK